MEPDKKVKCRTCLGHGEVFCPVCRGTKKDPRYINAECGYCNGKGHVKCGSCLGTGQVHESDYS
ncbi:MAG: hypothetical protein IKI49_00775 [Oscillospiraceae bacterium]|nr:hypothetical protein [Oscillospiraceae bacterium]